jgi:quercetin dioxygenase-like cupin family protein
MAFKRNINDLPVVEEIPKVKRRAVCGDRVMIALITYEADAVVGEHWHESEQIIYVLEGQMSLRICEEEEELEAGDVAVIPSNTPHATKARAKTTFLEAFHPIRLSYLVGYLGPTDAIFKGDKKTND